MKYLSTLVLTFFSFFSFLSAADTFTFTGASSADWLDLTNWTVASTGSTPSVFPSISDTVIIPGGKTCTVNSDGYIVNALDLTVAANGILNFQATGANSGTLILGNNLTIDGVLNVGGQSTGSLVDLISLQSSSSIISGGGNLNILAGGNFNAPQLQIPDSADIHFSGSLHVTAHNWVFQQSGLAIPSTVGPPPTTGTVSTVTFDSGTLLTIIHSTSLSCQNGVSVVNNGEIDLEQAARISWDTTTTDIGGFTNGNSSGILKWTVSSSTAGTAISSAGFVQLGGTLQIIASGSLSPGLSFVLFDGVASLFNAPIHSSSPDFLTKTLPPGVTTVKSTSDYSITVSQIPQTVSITSLGTAPFYYGDTLNPVVSKMGTGQTTWTTNNPSVIQIIGGLPQVRGVGSATITATVAQDANYLSNSDSITFSTQARPVTVQTVSATRFFGDANPTPVLSAPNLASFDVISILGTPTITYQPSTPGPATHPGTYQVNLVSLTGNSNYAISYGTMGNLTIQQAHQSISFTGPLNVAPGMSLTLPRFSSVNLPVSYTFASATSLATINVDGSGNPIVTGVANGGPVSIVAHQSGNTDYAAATDVPQNLVIGQVAQTISGFSPVTSMLFGAFTALNATATSGLSVSYQSSDTGVIQITLDTNGNPQLSAVGIGSATITAAQVGNTSYSAAPSLTTVITVNKIPQTITFPAVGPLAINETATLQATSSIGSSLTYQSSDSTIADFPNHDNVLTAMTAGTATITASFAGDATHLAASNTITVTVTKLSQTITFPSISNVVVGQSVPLSATSSASLPITYASSNVAIGMINGAAVIGVGAGMATITATQAGDATHLAATGTQTVTVTAAPVVDPPVTPPTTTGPGASGGGCGAGSGAACLLGLAGFGLLRRRRDA